MTDTEKTYAPGDKVLVLHPTKRRWMKAKVVKVFPYSEVWEVVEVVFKKGVRAYQVR